jgi:hypothetical protein
MPAVTLTTDDLVPFADIAPAKAQAMIDDALGQAALVAPCIFDYEFQYAAAAKGVLRQVVLRWNDAGTGASQQLVALGFPKRWTLGRTVGPCSGRRRLNSCSRCVSAAKPTRTARHDALHRADTRRRLLAESGCNFLCGADLSLSYPLWKPRRCDVSNSIRGAAGGVHRNR